MCLEKQLLPRTSSQVSMHGALQVLLSLTNPNMVTQAFHFPPSQNEEMSDTGLYWPVLKKELPVVEMTTVLSQQEQIKLADGSAGRAACHHNAVYHGNCITERKKHFSQQSEPERCFSQGKRLIYLSSPHPFSLQLKQKEKRQCFQNWSY